ncbi:MAG TPA: hypothetical protein VNT53_00780 [Pseudolysinimonas sp.]|nr:hypothetical protein [Pseudolysinimonas sp.]
MTDTPETPSTPASEPADAAAPASDATPADSTPTAETNPTVDPAPTAELPARSGLKLPVLLGIIGGAIVVVIALVLVAVLVVVPLFAPKSSTQVLVKDLTEEPDELWTYDYTAGNDGDSVSGAQFIPIGSGKILVVPSFDTSSQSSGGSSWYEGYDDDYDQGFDAGTEYAAAVDAYLQDLSSTEYPDTEDYWPFDGSYDDYDYENYAGFYDGFSDGRNGDEAGTSQAEKPVEPDFTPTLALVDAKSGDEIWTIDISKLDKKVTFESIVDAFAIEGTNYLGVVAAHQTDDGGAESTVTTVDLSSGKRVSQAKFDSFATAFDANGQVVVIETEITDDGDAGDSTMSSLNPGNLDDDARWETDVEGYTGYALGKFVAVTPSDSDKEGAVYDLATGKEADFGDDLGSDVEYAFVGDQLIRLEYSEDGDSVEVDGINTQGKSVWKKSVDADDAWVTDNEIFIADSTGDDAYESLQRLNVSNGEEVWKDTYDDEFLYVDVAAGAVVLGTEKGITVVNLGSGEEVYSEKSDASSSFTGSSQFYLAGDGELSAYKPTEDGDIWSFDYDDDEEITQIGQYLAVLNDSKDEVTLLGVK